MTATWILPALLAVPLAGAGVLLLAGHRSERWASWLGLVVQSAGLVLALAALAAFDVGSAGTMQLVTEAEWIPELGVDVRLGVDGVSLPLVVLTSLLGWCAAVYSVRRTPERARAFVGLLLLLQVGMLGTFTALDLVVFFVFFEVVLAPMWFLIAFWGTGERRRAANTFILYTVLGSVVMLVGFLVVMAATGTADMVQLAAGLGAEMSSGTQLLAALLILAGLAVKTPMWPFHTWLPDAHTAAPTVGSVMLAGVMLKMGTYGMVRIVLPTLPDAMRQIAPYLAAFAVIGIIYGALASYAQDDLKRVIAFSSVGHMGFVLLGISTLSAVGVNAALFGNLAHGLITGLLFFVVGAVKERVGTTSFADLPRGLYGSAPRLGFLLGFAAVASLGLPGLAGFWGEFLSLVAAFRPAVPEVAYYQVLLVLAAVGMVLAAVYFLRVLRRVGQGPEPETRLPDVAADEWLAWLPLVLLIVVLGVAPALVFEITEPAVRLVVEAGGIMSIQSIDLPTLLPTIVVAGGASLALVVDLVARRGQVTLAVGLLALLVAMPLTLVASGQSTLCGGTAACAYVVAPATVALQLIVLFGTLLVLLMSAALLADRSLPAGEFVFLLLASTSGALLVPATSDLVTLIVALEVVSLPTFALVALRRGASLAAEAAAKAFLYSIASVAVSLYGVALLYGTTGDVTFAELAAWADSTEPSPLATTGLVMLLAVLAFKVAAVPFHAWAPDTYLGAAVPVAAYLSVVSKVAGFSALLLVSATFASWQQVWAPVVAVLAAASMIVGNVVALRQRLAVRLLAWSSIAQAGYVLVPLGALAGSARWDAGVVAAVIGYLVAYAAMNLGAFAVVEIVQRRTGAEALTDYRGLVRRSPWLAVSLAFFLAALAGLPPGLIGLFVKVRVLVVPVDADLWWLVAVMAVATVIGLAYYLYWAALLFRRPENDVERIRDAGRPAQLAVGVALVATVVLSVFPSLALGLVDRV